MSKEAKYLIESISNDIILFLMEDFGCSLEDALGLFYNSVTYEKLRDEAIGLYIESSSYVYNLLKEEDNCKTLSKKVFAQA